MAVDAILSHLGEISRAEHNSYEELRDIVLRDMSTRWTLFSSSKEVAKVIFTLFTTPCDHRFAFVSVLMDQIDWINIEDNILINALADAFPTLNAIGQTCLKEQVKRIIEDNVRGPHFCRWMDYQLTNAGVDANHQFQFCNEILIMCFMEIPMRAETVLVPLLKKHRKILPSVMADKTVASWFGWFSQKAVDQNLIELVAKSLHSRCSSIPFTILDVISRIERIADFERHFLAHLEPETILEPFFRNRNCSTLLLFFLGVSHIGRCNIGFSYTNDLDSDNLVEVALKRWNKECLTTASDGSHPNGPSTSSADESNRGLRRAAAASATTSSDSTSYPQDSIQASPVMVRNMRHLLYPMLADYVAAHKDELLDDLESSFLLSKFMVANRSEEDIGQILTPIAKKLASMELFSDRDLLLPNTNGITNLIFENLKRDAYDFATLSKILSPLELSNRAYFAVPFVETLTSWQISLYLDDVRGQKIVRLLENNCIPRVVNRMKQLSRVPASVNGMRRPPF